MAGVIGLIIPSAIILYIGDRKMKRKYFLCFSLVLSIMFFSCAQTTLELNPSGVWQLRGLGSMSYKLRFSWGENPTYNQATVIDLGDPHPFINTGWGRFDVITIKRNGNRYYFTGKWRSKEDGSISLFFKDSDTMWFENTDPKGREFIGEKYFFRRVPIDAPLIPVDPEKGP
jgi:hypothetical protein